MLVDGAFTVTITPQCGRIGGIRKAPDLNWFLKSYLKSENEAKDQVSNAIKETLEHGGANNMAVHVKQGNIHHKILKFAHRDDFNMIVMFSAKGDFPNYEIGPNLARVVRNAHWTVLIVQDCTY